MEILIVLVPVLFLIFAYRLKSPKYKGIRGESSVARQLKKLNDDEFKVLNDVLIRTSHGSSQIDHIVISKYGIFVIETKNYSGWIHGRESSEYWTQSIYSKKTKFHNPIKQNWAHIYALKEVLSEFEPVIYHPIVVFAGSAELKNIYSNIPVIYDNEIYKTVMDKREIANLSIKQVNNIADKLNGVNITDEKAMKEHVHQVQSHTYDHKSKVKSLVCPKCGGILVLRDGQHGKFYGCSNYPRCRFSQSYDGR